jgi:hypothetical protein
MSQARPRGMSGMRKPKSTKPNAVDTTLAVTNRDYNQPPSCKANLKRKEHKKLASERAYSDPRRKRTDRVWREERWKHDVREHEAGTI